MVKDAREFSFNQAVAIRMWDSGITEAKYIEMFKGSGLSQGGSVEIQNYLRDFERKIKGENYLARLRKFAGKIQL